MPAHNDYVYIACDVPSKEADTVQKKYEVLYKKQLIGFVWCNYVGEWMWDGCDKDGYSRGVQSRTAAAEFLRRRVTGR